MQGEEGMSWDDFLDRVTDPIQPEKLTRTLAIDGTEVGKVRGIKPIGL